MLWALTGKLVLSIVIVEFAFVFIGGSFLVLLVFADQVIHVAFGFSEFHLVHALASVPMQESLATEHGSELLAHALEKFLDGSGVADEGGRHLQATRWNVADGGLDVVRDPFYEVAVVLILNVHHLLIDVLHRHAATEDCGDSQIATVTWIASGHHVLGVEHLLSQFWNGQSAILLGTTRCEWSEPSHEEVQTWEWNHVDGELTKISIQLAREAQASGDACETRELDSWLALIE